MAIDDSMVAVVGAGNGAQAFAGSLAARGYGVRMLVRSGVFSRALGSGRIIRCRGVEEGEGRVEAISQSPADVIPGAGIVIVCTTADAHEGVAESVAPYLEDGQILLLSPGRTGGALVVRRALSRAGVSSPVVVAEAQSLVYACRAESAGNVHLIGIKKDVPVGVLDPDQCPSAIARLQRLYPAFSAANGVLETSLGNIGSVFHPAVAISNAAAIERGTPFLVYRDMTAPVADLILRVDAERVALERAFDLQPLSVMEWMDRAYPDCSGEDLLGRMRSNPAYAEIQAPSRLNGRFLTEDIPAGLVPMVNLGESAGVQMPVMRSMVELGGALLGRDFWTEGRSLEKMGLAGLGRDEIRRACGMTADSSI